jgi:hypothetical protein
VPRLQGVIPEHWPRRRGRPPKPLLHRPRLLELLAEDYRARGGGRGTIAELADAYDFHRTQIWRLLREAQAAGLIPEGLPTRSTAAAP